MRALFVLAVCFVNSLAAVAQHQCSLIVQVLSPRGGPGYAVVDVREMDGRELQQDYKGKNLEFCDLGILPVTVTAHLGPSCTEVAVHNVFTSLDRSYVLKIIYDPEDCSPEPSPIGATCHLLLRVRDSEGKAVPNASIHLRMPKDSQHRSDRFGRLLIPGGCIN
jgi:hypothetical protein